VATILTVHGTFASGQARGEKWWQEGSPFEAHLRELVEADSGELRWQPVIWNGLNSEASRRLAGVKLSEEMLALEERGEPYCVIGHSHGGSVISAALLECANRKNRLAQLGAWLTIGTPFIRTIKHRFLFSRLSGMGRSIYVGLIVGGLIGLVAILESIWRVSQLAPEADRRDMMLFLGKAALPTIGLTLLSLILLYLLILGLQRNLLLAHKGKIVAFAAQSFKARWVSLRHANDEALAGLRSLRTLDLDIFSKRFAVSAVSRFVVLLVLLAVVIPLFWPAAMKALFELMKEYQRGAIRSVAPDGKLLGDGHDVLVNARLLLGTGALVLLSVADPFTSWMNTWIRTHIDPAVNFELNSVIPMVTILSALIAVALLWLIQLLAVALSYFFSRMLNPVAREQIRATGFGSDTRGDKAVDTRDFPMWLKEGKPPLPEVLAQEIQATSDQAAAAAISNFRRALGTLALSKGVGETSDVLSVYLTWDELIHTSYFKSARFRKFVAYSLAQVKGFRATAAFKQDPHYPLVAAWYEDIVATPSRTCQAEPAGLRPGYVPQYGVEG